MNSVVELHEFRRRAEGRLTDDERFALIDYVAENPEAGVLIRGTGGVRKLRWGASGRGKSGGARVIYCFHDASMPLFLVTVYLKKEKANITAEERNQMRMLTGLLVEEFRR